MPKFCVNYLMELRKLFEENDELVKFIDYIKLYSINGDLSPFDWCVSKRNIMFHGMICGGARIADSEYFESRDIELQKDYYKRGNTPYISVHIDRKEENIGEQETIKIISQNIKRLKEIFEMRIILENVPVRIKNQDMHFLSSPEFISKVVKENDCGFLFDIGHARSAAQTLNIPFEQYVDRLPMDKVIEMHLAGSMYGKDGILYPNHSKMNEEDYDFVRKALKKYNTIETITLEYGPIIEHDLQEKCVLIDDTHVNEFAKEELREQIRRLKEIIKLN